MHMDAHTVVEHTRRMIPLPDTVVRLNRLLSEPDYPVPAIGHLIDRDSELRSRLLDLVNSSFFGFPSNIRSVPRALTILGTRDLCELALATSAVRTFQAAKESAEESRLFWSHSVRTAVIARELAKSRHVSNPERLFVAGLLHDLGSLALHCCYPEISRKSVARARQSGRRLDLVEQELFGSDHCEIGAALAQGWHFPAMLAAIIRHHHDPAGAPRYRLETALVHVADFLTHSRMRSGDLCHHQATLDPVSWDLVGMQSEQLQTLVDNAIAQARETEDLLLARAHAA